MVGGEDAGLGGVGRDRGGDLAGGAAEVVGEAGEEADAASGDRSGDAEDDWPGDGERVGVDDEAGHGVGTTAGADGEEGGGWVGREVVDVGGGDDLGAAGSEADADAEGAAALIDLVKLAGNEPRVAAGEVGVGGERGGWGDAAVEFFDEKIGELGGDVALEGSESLAFAVGAEVGGGGGEVADVEFCREVVGGGG